MSWGLAVLMLAGLFAYQLWESEREQDRAMCAMLDILISGPEPVAGPAGDRGRAVLTAIRVYQDTLHCD
jgi:hypothetical protein